MENIVTYIGQTLYWLQPKVMQRYFELRSEDSALLATLSLDKGLGIKGRAESADGMARFEPKGFFKAGTVIYKPPSDIAVAKFSPKLFGKGALEFADGRRYEFGAANIWGREWSFTDTLGQPIVKLRNEQKIRSFADIFKARGKVEIAPEASNVPDLVLLAAFGWYMLMVMRQRRSRTGA